MNAIWQVLLALLAVVGLLALGWLLFGKLVTPVGAAEAARCTPWCPPPETGNTWSRM